MGRGVATALVTSGFDVAVCSRSTLALEQVGEFVGSYLDRRIEKGALDSAGKEGILNRLQLTTSLDDLFGCDLVIESIVEDHKRKIDVFERLDKGCVASAILASNTSTIPIAELASATDRPDRVCGMHWFNPAPIMPLVEIASALLSSDSTVDAVTEVAQRCGKTVIHVDDVAGFVVNQVLFGYLSSALRLLGTTNSSIEDIDAAMRGGLNFPMGPFQLIDLIGVDVCVASFDALYSEYREPQFNCPPRLRRMTAAGRLGRKVGRGFYSYEAT